MAADVDSIKRFISLGLSTADWVVKIGPGEADDKLLASLKVLADKPWFAELIVYVLGLFDSGKPVTLAEVVEAVAEFNKVSGTKYENA